MVKQPPPNRVQQARGVERPSTTHFAALGKTVHAMYVIICISWIWVPNHRSVCESIFQPPGTGTCPPPFLAGPMSATVGVNRAGQLPSLQLSTGPAPAWCPPLSERTIYCLHTSYLHPKYAKSSRFFSWFNALNPSPPPQYRLLESQGSARAFYF